MLAVLAPFGVLFAVDGLVTGGDPVQTASDIAGSEMLFRLGIVSLLAVAAIDVAVAWALHQVLRPASSSLSILTAWFRLAYATVLLVGVAHLVGALRLLDTPPGAFSTAQNQAQALSEVEAFHDVFSAGLVLFGAHLLLVGYVAYRSRFVPRLLAALVCLAGVGYAFDSIVSVLSSGSAPAVASVTFLGELLLGVWLLTPARRLTERPSARLSLADGR
ncbi:MAG: hypothetical protein JWO60_179 [Frankiales bacterium]|nr:hypothetical protein [Frankiales bacterium]